MLLKRWLTYSVILGGILFGLGLGASASSWQEPDYSVNCDEVARCVANAGVVREYYGEIVGINAETVELLRDGVRLSFKFTDFPSFFCNGYEAKPETLMPVTENAYFEAVVYVDAQGRACLVNGFYYGMEGVICDYQQGEQGLQLTLYQLDQDRTNTLRISSKARLPRSNAWFDRGNVVYVLYGYYGEIRAVYVD